MKYGDVNNWEDITFKNGDDGILYLYDYGDNNDFELVGDYYNGKADDNCWNVRYCKFDLSEFTEIDFESALESLEECEAKKEIENYYDDNYTSGLMIAEEAYYECSYMGENIKENLTKEEADAFVKEYVKNN